MLIGHLQARMHSYDASNVLLALTCHPLAARWPPDVGTPILLHIQATADGCLELATTFHKLSNYVARACTHPLTVGNGNRCRRKISSCPYVLL